MNDYKNYRPIPRTLSEAFGPHARLDTKKARRRELWFTVAGILILGAAYGFYLAS